MLEDQESDAYPTFKLMEYINRLSSTLEHKNVIIEQLQERIEASKKAIAAHEKMIALLEKQQPGNAKISD